MAKIVVSKIDDDADASNPSQLAARRFADMASALSGTIDQASIIKGMLDAALSFGFHAGMGATATGRLLRHYSDSTGLAFEAMSAYQAAKRRPN